MADTTGTHDGHEYDAFWHPQEKQIFWGAVVKRGGKVVGRPHGQLMVSAVDGDEEAAVRKVVESAIDNGLDVERPVPPDALEGDDHSAS